MILGLLDHLRCSFVRIVRKVVGRLDQGRKQRSALGINFRNRCIALIAQGKPVNVQSHRAVTRFDARNFGRQTPFLVADVRSASDHGIKFCQVGFDSVFSVADGIFFDLDVGGAGNQHQIAYGDGAVINGSTNGFRQLGASIDTAYEARKAVVSLVQIFQRYAGCDQHDHGKYPESSRERRLHFQLIQIHAL
ncbi:protein of unknown function [Burkholderia multivorans]